MARLKQLNVAGLCGSLRAASYNRASLDAAGRLMPGGTALRMEPFAQVPIYCADAAQHPVGPGNFDRTNDARQLSLCRDGPATADRGRRVPRQTERGGRRARPNFAHLVCTNTSIGLGPAGEIVSVGSHVHTWKPGDRVYVNPGLYCGGCRACRKGDLINCTHYAFRGYFGFSQNSLKLYANYPGGGLAEYMTAPQYALVKLPDNVTFEQATRFGYLGTMYSAMRKTQVGPGKTLLVNGISGTLGIGGALFGLAMGCTRILGTGRDKRLLEKVKALAPDRIDVLSIADNEPIDAWAKSKTNGLGVDVFIDALGPGAQHETMQQGVRALKRGGRAVNIGAIAGMVGMDLHTMMDDQQSIEGSAWFTAAEGQDIADMAEAGTLNLSVLEHVCSPLDQVNEAISGIAQRNGGFSNFVIQP